MGACINFNSYGLLLHLACLWLLWRDWRTSFGGLITSKSRFKRDPPSTAEVPFFSLPRDLFQKNKEVELGKKLPNDFRPRVDLQGKITPDPQLHMDPQIIPAPRRPWKISHSGLTLQGRKKWCERVSKPKFLQCRKLTLPHEIHFLNLLQ